MERILKRLTAVILAIAFVISPFSVVNAASKKTIKLSTKKIVLEVGQEKTITLKNARTVDWSTSKKKVAGITDSGADTCTITAKKKGKAKITAICNGKKYVCNVIVKKASVKLDKSAKVKVSKTKTIKLKYNTKKVTWSTDDSKIIRLSKKKKNSVKIKGLKNGTAKVFATIGKKTYVCNVTVGKPYTYKVTPLMAPFNEYFYIETENPDPKSFRLVDRKSKYASTDEDDYDKDSDAGYGFITPVKDSFIDVKYTDAKTLRVKGGYIASGTFTDGGELYVQELITQDSGWGFKTQKVVDKCIKVTCPDVVDYIDYLIQTYTSPANDFFTNVSSIQKALDEIAVYPKGTYDKSKPNTKTPYPFYTAGYYLDQTYLLEHYEDMFDSAGKNFGYWIYPYILDSLGFPSTVARAARRLNPNCIIQRTEAHYIIEITLDGVTKRYGGAGGGGYNPLYSDRVNPNLFSFEGGAEDFATGLTIQRMQGLLKEYSKYSWEDEQYYYDLLQGNTFKEKTKGGTWIRIYGNAYAYVTSSKFRYSDDVNVYSVGDVWVDGRYILNNHAFVKGETFDKHPDADIIVRGMTYTNYDKEEKTGDVHFYYDKTSDTWRATDEYGYHGDYKVDPETGYMKFVYDENYELPDEFVLTRDEVLAMNIDGNRDVDPPSGLIYDGTAFPGTPF